MNNTEWASHIIDELVQLGVTLFSISPGSRSTPLVAAVANHPQAESVIHVDERGAAFFALGYARATQKPAAVICTSGTAVANWMPAVVEASQECLPMVLLSADRPPELLDCGANQAIRQEQIFGTYVRHYREIPCPAPELSAKWLRTTLDQAVYQTRTGPVHLNCQFRKPLDPEPIDSVVASGPATHYNHPEPQLHSVPLKGPGVIVAGRMESAADQQQVLDLAETLQWPVLPDITSGLRLGVRSEWVIPHFEELLPQCQPKTVLWLGGRVVSVALEKWMEEADCLVRVADHPFRQSHAVTHRIECSISTFCRAAVNSIGPTPFPALEQWQQASVDREKELEERLSHEITEESVVYQLTRSLQSGDALFTASSLPIRHLQSVGSALGGAVSVTANRGASGIDGTIATAAGYAKGLDRTVTLLIGDLAFFHDLNSLAYLKETPMRVVLLNNGGGGIFQRLPIAKHTDLFTDYFQTPQHLSFEKAADAFGIPYRQLNDWIDLEGTGVVEVKVPLWVPASTV